MRKKLLSIGETAKLLGVSIDTLRQWDKKNILTSFRPSVSSKRYYQQENIDIFLKKSEKNTKDYKKLAKNWVTRKSSIPPSLYCETSDIFFARLQRLSSEIKKIPELQNIFPLIIAIAGEIGNNSYNHNIGNWPDVMGIFFSHDIQKRQIILADRGQGILKTLKRVLPNLKTDQEALKVAFTQYISGRAPEDRGNGLKFVCDIVTQNPLQLQFYSGDTVLNLKENTTLDLRKTQQQIRGCLAIIHWNLKKNYVT